MKDYAEFLARKQQAAPAVGIAGATLSKQQSKVLFPFQRELVEWALQRGRAALFEGCGLGKTRQALIWAQQVSEHTGKPVLILTPLAVSKQFFYEGAQVGVNVALLRSTPNVDNGVLATNYEQLDKLDALIPRLGGVVLDESSILKSFDGKTRTRLIEAFARTPFRLACTATPSPNDPAELGNHAEFLGYSRHVDMLNRYFEHDAGDTGTWILKGHGRKPFWRWIASWARCINKPSDMGHSDDGYDLPALEMHEHVVDIDSQMARQAGQLFAYEATTLSEQRAVRRASLEQRVAVAARMVNEDREQWIVWAGLNDEAEALDDAIPDAINVTGSDSIEAKESAVERFLAGEVRVLVTKKSILAFGTNAQCCARQVDVGVDWSFESTYQAIRRSWRFGQRLPVQFHQICTSADGRMVAGLRRKMAEFDAMHRDMREAISGA